jgi:hypothetical protein
MFLKRIFFFGIIFISLNSGFAQVTTDTCYKSFFKSYKEPSGFTEFKDVCRTSDGGYVAVGHNLFYNPIILKLNSRGDIQWDSLFIGTTWANKVLQTLDGNFVVSTFNYGTNSQLSKFTNDGRLLWSKQYTDQSYNGMQLADIKETIDSGFVMIFNSQYGFPPIYTSIVKVDSKRSIIWRKSLLTSNTNPILESLWIENNDIYVAADFYITPRAEN